MSVAQKSFKAAVVAPLVLAAFATCANAESTQGIVVADAQCSRVYDSSRGVFPGDCYPREEAQKFACLNVNPEKGPVSEACGKPDAFLPVYFGKRAGTPYTNILTSTLDGSKGAVLESSHGEYHVGYVYKDIQFGDLGNSVPSWADPANVAPNRDDRIAAALCGQEAGCRIYGTTYAKIHDLTGTRYAMGARGLALSQDGKSLEAGKYFIFRAEGEDAAIDLVGPRGDSHMEFALTPVGAVTDNIARIQASKPTTVALAP